MSMFKRIVSISLVAITLFTLLLNPFMVILAADGDGNSASSRQADFINFYSNNVSSLDMNSLTVQDYYVLAVFASNYFKPGVTTLKDLLEPTSADFFSSLTQQLGNPNANFTSNLGSMLMAVGKDIQNTIESDHGTLLKNSTGRSVLTGNEFLALIKDSVDITYSTLKSKKAYFNDGSNKTGFDFSSPATKAAFQIIFAYDYTLFINNDGINSYTMLFLDQIGNLWGLKKVNQNGYTYSDGALKGLVAAEGAENIKLIMPACVNPSVFSVGVTNPQDLRMPLMNRFTLGAIMDTSDFKSTVQTENIPFYNLLSNDALGMATNTLNKFAIFGVNSLSPILLNVGHGGPISGRTNGTLDGGWTTATGAWSESSFSSRGKDIANFLWNPELVSLNTSVTNGIGKYGTNTYIIFSPTSKMIESAAGQDSTSSYGNRNIDLHTIGKYAFDIFVFDQDKSDALEKQQAFFAYFLTPTALSLNQISMSLYLQVASNSSGSEEMFSDLIANGSAEDILETKLGMKGFDLFSYAQSRDKFDLSDGGSYRGILLSNIIHSKLTNKLANAFNYVNLRSDTFQQLEAGALSSPENNFLYSKTAPKEEKDAYQILLDYYNFNVVDPAIWGFSSSELSVGSDGHTTITINPKNILTMGSIFWDNCVDYPYGRTLGLGDSQLITILRALDGTSTLGAHLADGSKKPEDVKLVSTNGSVARYLMTEYGYSLFSTSPELINTLSNKESVGGLNVVNINDSVFIMGMYFGYLVDMMGITSIDGTGLSFGTFSSNFLPRASISANGGDMGFSAETNIGTGLINSEDLSFEQKQKDLIDRIYGLTNDSNNDYRNNLIKNILEGFILTVHRTITGTWYSNIDTIITGSSNTYQSVTGYIYTPTLEELSFTATLMNNYIKIYIFCFMIVMFLLVLMVLLNLKSWQQGVTVCGIMAVALLFPYVLISNSINISNRISDNIYSDRFDFWAMSEHQQSLTSIRGSTGLSERDRLLAISNASSDVTLTGNTGVKIKWMSPKKVDMFSTLYSDKSLSESFVTNVEIFKWLFNSLIYDSEFVDTDVYGSYLYRPYKSISTEAQAYYGWLQYLEDELKKDMNYTVNLDNGSSYNFNGIPSLYASNLDILSISDKNKKDFLYSLARADKSFYSKGQGKLYYDDLKLSDIATVGPLDLFDAGEVADRLGMAGSLSEEVSNRIVDSTYDVMSAGVTSNLPQVSSPEVSVAFAGSRGSDTEGVSVASVDSKNVSKALFLKNTESPYYYFYSVLKYRYTNGDGQNFKDMLLKNEIYKVNYEEQSILNTTRNVSGSFRDFLDLEGLFTYIIPYMKESNSYVSGWRAKNGSDVIEFDFGYEEYMDDNGEISEDYYSGKSSEYQDAVKRKNSMNKVWNMYCPWVDSLYDLDVLNKKVTVGGSKVSIGDTLNPSSYLEVGRPMIFSEADMIVKGYNYSNLTDVERRIQSVLEKTYTDMLYLVNYYDMDDEVLLSAAAMYATFNFNTEFSQNSFFGKTVMLYPQGFELKNFNYDAFMRLALLNSTGESVFATDDLYSRVLSKTSVFSGLLLIACDIVACILIPMFKFVILVGLLFLGLLVCIACVVNPPEKIFEAVTKSLLLPTFLFMALNIAFAWVMSFIVGEGLTSYVGSKTINFATNDPTITMLIMAVLGIAYVFCAWKVLQFLISAYKQFGVGTALAAVGIVGAAISGGAKGIAKRAAGILGAGAGAAAGAATAGSGNRLMGAVEGAGAGVGGVARNRLRDRSLANALKKANSGSSSSGDNETVTNNINEKASKSGNESDSGNQTPKAPGKANPKANDSESSSGSSSSSGGLNSSSGDRGRSSGSMPSEVQGGTMPNSDKPKANALGKIGAGYASAKYKALDTVDAAKHKFKDTKYVLSHLDMVGKEKVDQAADGIRGARDSVVAGAREVKRGTIEYLNRAASTYREAEKTKSRENAVRSVGRYQQSAELQQRYGREDEGKRGSVGKIRIQEDGKPTVRSEKKDSSATSSSKLSVSSSVPKNSRMDSNIRGNNDVRDRVLSNKSTISDKASTFRDNGSKSSLKQNRSVG